MIYAPNGMGGNVGIGFAVPSDTVARHVTQIIHHGQNARPSIGLSVLPDTLRHQYARHLRRELTGAIVAHVIPGGPADALNITPTGPDSAGSLRLGDMITQVNGTPVTRNEDLLCAVEEASADEPISLTLMRECDPEKVEEVSVMPVRRSALMASFGELEASAHAERAQAGAGKRMRRDW